MINVIISMRILFWSLLFLPTILLSQNSTEYIAKCRKNQSLFKKECDKLTLNNDGNFRLESIGSDLPIFTDGNYYCENDTIVTFDDLKSTEIIIQREPNENNSFNVRFTGYFDYPVAIDSIKVYHNEKEIKKASKTNTIEFADADSIMYFLKGKSFSTTTKLKEYKEKKKIRISLPVGYYIRKDNKKIVGVYTKLKYRKINIP
jgi:hypothetical protein